MLSIIVAMTDSRVIGLKNALPWRIPSDLKRFKHYTMGKSLVMGRRTYDSLPGPLIGRHVIVVSTKPRPSRHDVTFVSSPEEALLTPRRDHELLITGGEALYRWFLTRQHIERLYLTRVFADISGDAHFPELAWSTWSLEHCSPIIQCAGDAYPTRFEIWRQSIE